MKKMKRIVLMILMIGFIVTSNEVHASNIVDIVPPEDTGEATGTIEGEIKGPEAPVVPPIEKPEPDNPNVPVVPDKPPVVPEKPKEPSESVEPSQPDVPTKTLLHFSVQQGTHMTISKTVLEEAMKSKKNIYIDVYDEQDEKIIKYQVIINGKGLTEKDVKEYTFDLQSTKTHEHYLKEAYKDNKDLVTYCVCPFEKVSLPLTIRLKVESNQDYYVYGYDIKNKVTKLLNKNVKPDKDGFIYVEHKKGYDYITSVDELKTPLSSGKEVEKKETNNMDWLIVVTGGISILLMTTGIYLGIRKKRKDNEK